MRMSEDEKAELMRQADELGLSASAYIRYLVNSHAKADKKKPARK